MKKQAFTSGLALTATVIFFAGVALPAPAQMVPRLVDYPTSATNSGPCNAQPGANVSTQRVVTYAQPYWRRILRRETVSVYGTSNCSSGSLLFTLTSDAAAKVLSVTATELGIAALESHCSAASWHANVPAALTPTLYKALGEFDTKSACAQIQAQQSTAERL